MESSTTASNALMKSVESSREASVALGVSSQSLKDSIKPINEMIRSASSLTESSLTASSTLREMVENVPSAFHDPIGGMISAGEFLADAVAEMAKQMASVESLFAAVGHTRGAAEIQALLARIEAASASVAAGQNNISNQANGWWRDSQSLQQGMTALTDELKSLNDELRQQRPRENF
jgi:prophage DNA circulation protein